MKKKFSVAFFHGDTLVIVDDNYDIVGMNDVCDQLNAESATLKLEIGRCMSCPFADVASGIPRVPTCSLPFFLDETRLDDGRPFGDRDANGWLVYPLTPPSWCGLRKGGLKIAIAEEGVEEAK